MSMLTLITLPYLIQPGDTIKTIAEKFQTTPSHIMRLNGNQPLLIRPHIELLVPKQVPIGFTIYFLKPGDTLVEIAQAHDLTVEELLAINSLRAHQFQEVQFILVPETLEPRYHLVHPNETIQDLLTRFKLTPEDLIDLNDEIYLKSGQIIKVDY